MIFSKKYNKYLKNKFIKQFPVNIETEKMYYRTIFEENYKNHIDILPYFWMPKYSNATDPSARTLDIYNSTN